jgi:hypothetical protein
MRAHRQTGVFLEQSLMTALCSANWGRSELVVAGQRRGLSLAAALLCIAMEVFLADPDDIARLRSLSDKLFSGSSIKAIQLADGSSITGLVVGSRQQNTQAPGGSYGFLSTVTLYVSGRGRQTFNLATQIVAVSEPSEDACRHYQLLLERSGGKVPE